VDETRSSRQTSGQARCGWSGRRANRSRRWPGSWGSRKGRRASTTLWSDDVWAVDSTPVECGRSRDAARSSLTARA
jgi:hypothetical protein